MADHVKALVARTESSPDARPDLALSGTEPPFSAPLRPLDFDGTLTLDDGTLRAIACESPVPGARLAAAWRLMMRAQALPAGAPGEGLRRLTLLNLATQQDLEILEVLLCLDPSAGVRAQAALLLWRVARDRDRVVDRLVSQLGQEAAPEVLVQLLSLVPALPFEKTRSLARSYLCHPALEVRRAGWGYWLQNGGPMVSHVTGFIWREPSRELRAWCLQGWARGPGYADMPRDVGECPDAAGAVLEALALAGRSFRLTEMDALLDLLDHCHLEAVLGIARRPFNVADRWVLVALTGLMALEPGVGSNGADRRPWRERPGFGWIGEALWRCLHEAYLDPAAPALSEEEKSWAPLLGEQIAALEANAPAEEYEDEYGYDDEESPDGLADRRRLLRFLTSSPAAPSP